VLLAAAAVPLVLLPGPFAVPASAAQPCVGVVVDARLLGGGVSTGCAEGDPGSGLEALEAAGFRYAFAPRLPGFVCQIDAAPECSRTGPTTYWSYWYRTKGSRTWVYSSAGAGSHDPAPGSTEAWVWQEGGRREPPDVALETICPQVATSRIERAVPSPSSSRASDSAATASPSRRTTGTAGRSPSPASPEPATPAPASTSATTELLASTASSASSAPTTTQSAAGGFPADDDGTDRTPWTGVVLGGGLVAALGAAALARSRRSGDRP